MTDARNLSPNEIADKKLQLMSELYSLISENTDKKKAFFDVRINKDYPKESVIRANRPGVELFATELLMEMEDYYDESADIRFEKSPINVGDWCKRKAKVHFSHMEVQDFEDFRDDLNLVYKRSFFRQLLGSLGAIFLISVYILALFGLVAVIRFFAE